MIKEKNNLKSKLDEQVKTLNDLLSTMDEQSRYAYIKDMLPHLLSFKSKYAEARTKLEESMKNPVQELTSEEMELIKKAAEKTEALYKAKNDDYFG